MKGGCIAVSFWVAVERGVRELRQPLLTWINCVKVAIERFTKSRTLRYDVYNALISPKCTQVSKISDTKRKNKVGCARSIALGVLVREPAIFFLAR